MKVILSFILKKLTGLIISASPVSMSFVGIDTMPESIKKIR